MYLHAYTYFVVYAKDRKITVLIAFTGKGNGILTNLLLYFFFSCCFARLCDISLSTELEWMSAKFKALKDIPPYNFQCSNSDTARMVAASSHVLFIFLVQLFYKPPIHHAQYKAGPFVLCTRHRALCKHFVKKKSKERIPLNTLLPVSKAIYNWFELYLIIDQFRGAQRK